MFFPLNYLNRAYKAFLENTSVSSVQSLSRVHGVFVTPWITARQASLSVTNSRNSLRLTSIESVMPFSHLILGRPLLPPIHPSIRVSSNESTLCMRWPKYWSFSLFLAISKARFDFQKQAAYHQQICHNEHCKSLSLRIHKTNRKVPTCGFLISLVNPAEETGYSYGLSLAVFH